jgi:hypothetical protein
MPRYGGHLALRAHETGDGPLDISERVRRDTKMRLVFEGWQARRGPTALTSRQRGASPRGCRGRRSSLSAAHGEATPAERPAHRRRSGARPSSISAGQRDSDCVFLQKVELCDKNGRYESCRWDIPLQYLQRLSYVFLNGLSRNAKQSSGFAERWWIVKTAVDQVFHPFPLKIWNAIQHESCVPRKARQLLYW